MLRDFGGDLRELVSGSMREITDEPGDVDMNDDLLKEAEQLLVNTQAFRARFEGKQLLSG